MPHLPTNSRKQWQGDKPKRGAFQSQPDERYQSYRWRQLSKAFRQRHPICATPECGQLSAVTDHITPVSQGGDFWNGPFQALCHSCHNTKTNAERQKNT